VEQLKKENSAMSLQMQDLQDHFVEIWAITFTKPNLLKVVYLTLSTLLGVSGIRMRIVFCRSSAALSAHGETSWPLGLFQVVAHEPIGSVSIAGHVIWYL
jgi:hypothetical protein